MFMSVINTTFFFFFIILTSCQNNIPPESSKKAPSKLDSKITTSSVDSTAREIIPLEPSSIVDTRDVKPTELILFAKTLIGTPYLYASVNPRHGFDCSGFITYVFNHFQISVPRSSKDFSVVGMEVDVRESLPGDLILFSGTNPEDKSIGHMGIITENRDTVKFIHSTSGKAYGVTVTPLNEGYKKRFMKVVRVFK